MKALITILLTLFFYSASAQYTIKSVTKTGSGGFDTTWAKAGVWDTNYVRRNGVIVPMGTSKGRRFTELENINGLQVALDAKATSSHTHAYNTITGAPSLFDGNYNSLINKPAIPDVTGKVNYSDTATMLLAYKNGLNGKQATGNYLVAADIAGKLNSNGNGSSLTNITAAQVGAEPTITVLSFAKGGISASAATSATTGTMTVNMTSSIITITPTGACTFNASGGVAGQIVTFSITTSGVSSFVLTWGTNFRKTGTLATGTTSARFFTVTFRCLDGTIWSEIGRTAAQT